jgi:hypothetical protein
MGRSGRFGHTHSSMGGTGGASEYDLQLNNGKPSRRERLGSGARFGASQTQDLAAKADADTSRVGSRSLRPPQGVGEASEGPAAAPMGTHEMNAIQRNIARLQENMAQKSDEAGNRRSSNRRLGATSGYASYHNRPGDMHNAQHSENIKGEGFGMLESFGMIERRPSLDGNSLRRLRQHNPLRKAYQSSSRPFGAASGRI